LAGTSPYNQPDLLPDSICGGGLAQHASTGACSALLQFSGPSLLACIRVNVPGRCGRIARAGSWSPSRNRLSNPRHTRFMAEPHEGKGSVALVDQAPIVTAPGVVVEIIRDSHAPPHVHQHGYNPVRTSMTAIKYRSGRCGRLEYFNREADRRFMPLWLLLHGCPSSSHMFRISSRFLPSLPPRRSLLPVFGQSEIPARTQFHLHFDHNRPAFIVPFYRSCRPEHALRSMFP